MLQIGKSSLQHELDDYFSANSNTYTKGAFSQYRAKLKPEVFVHLNTRQLNYFYDKAAHIQKWKGFRLVAIDGSTMQLPFSRELVKGFGHFETRTENNRKVVLARVSQAYDVLNQISVDARIEHYRTSELSLCKMHLSKLDNNDLVIMDRAYAAFWLMSLLQSQNKFFLIRLKANRWKVAKQFLNSKKKDQIIIINPSNEAVLRCRQHNAPVQPMTLRMTRVPIQSGEDHVLITNLVDQKAYSCAEIRGLYRKRWPVEESFKHLKLRAELENLTGKTISTVQQDFHRIILRANLSTILSKNLTYKGLKNINQRRKKNYQLNRTQAYRKSKKIIDTLFSHTMKLIEALEYYAIKLLEQTEIYRPNRSTPRVKRYSGKPVNFMAYKP